MKNENGAEAPKKKDQLSAECWRQHQLHDGIFTLLCDQASLNQVQGSLQRDQALLKNAQLDLQRYKDLLKQDSIASQQVDTQAALVRQLEGTVASDQAQVDAARLQLS